MSPVRPEYPEIVEAFKKNRNLTFDQFKKEGGSANVERSYFNAVKSRIKNELNEKKKLPPEIINVPIKGLKEIPKMRLISALKRVAHSSKVQMEIIETIYHSGSVRRQELKITIG